MKYRVGDRVKIFSLEEYCKIKGDNYELIFSDGLHFLSCMEVYCGQYATIVRVANDVKNRYLLDLTSYYWWAAECFDKKTQRKLKIRKLNRIAEDK